MPIDSSTIRAWAEGRKAGGEMPKKPGNPDMGEEPEDDLELDMEEGSAERQPLWAGEEPMGDEEMGEEISEEEADDLLTWLEENEPEIHDAVMELANAIAEDDVRMLEHAKEELNAATQYLNPEYPPMSPAEREKAGQNIAKHMRDKGNPSSGSKEWKQAVAIGMSEARRDKSH